MAQHLLEGRTEEEFDPTRPLRDKVLRLEAERDTAQAQSREWKAKYEEACSQTAAVRHELQPLFNAMRKLFGLLPADDQGASPPPGAMPDIKRHNWELWQEKLGNGTKGAALIGALLDHKEMNVAQLRVAMRCGPQTVYDTTSKLGRLGLLDKNGGKFSLKEL